MRENISYPVADEQVCIAVHLSGRHIDYNEVIAAENSVSIETLGEIKQSVEGVA